MPQNGYRLFVVSLHDNRKQDEEPFDAAQARTPPKGEKPPKINYLDLVESYVGDNADVTFNIGSGPDDADEDDAGTRIGTSTRLGKAILDGTAVRLWFKSGPIFSDGLLADSQGVEDDIDLAGRSTLQDFRAVLRIIAGGKRAILVVETRGRACPARPLIRALKSCSDLPWALRVHENVADTAAITTFVDNGRIEELELTEWTFDDDGHKSSRRNSLVSKVGLADQPKGKSRVKSWISGGKSTSKAKWKSEAQEVKKDFFSTKVEIPFNDVAMVVTNGSQTRRLKPSSDYKTFTYFLADKIVADSTFFTQADGTAKLLVEGVQPAPAST